MNMKRLSAGTLTKTAITIPQARVLRVANLASLCAGLVLSAPAIASEEAWKAQQLTDALSAAPAAVTSDAKVFAWTKNGERVLIREGSGPYTCVASGMTSLRVGKKALPYKDPACMDQNAWAFFEAFWAEKNPMKPSKPYPTAPGMTWMLAGMAVGGGMVKMDRGDADEHKITASGKKLVKMSPHIMIIPLPMDAKTTKLRGLYKTGDPDADWIMFPNTPLEHLMVHFSESDTKSMMESD